MAEVVEALEGSIAPIECISQSADGSIVCSRESDPSHVCPTKLLWTRVRGSIVQTLQETTLADLLVTRRASSPANSIPAPFDLPRLLPLCPLRLSPRPRIEQRNHG